MKTNTPRKPRAACPVVRAIRRAIDIAKALGDLTATFASMASRAMGSVLLVATVVAHAMRDPAISQLLNT